MSFILAKKVAFPMAQTPIFYIVQIKNYKYVFNIEKNTLKNHFFPQNFIIL